MRDRGAELTDRRELGAVHADHAQAADLAPAAEIEEREAHDADLLVGSRGTSADKSGGVLTGTNLLEDLIVSLGITMLGFVVVQPDTYHQHIQWLGHSLAACFGY